MYCLFARCSQFTPHTPTCSYSNSASHVPMCTYTHKHTNVCTHTHMHTHTHTHTYTQTVFDILDQKIFLNARKRSNPFETIKGVIFQNRLTLVYAHYSTVGFNTAWAVCVYCTLALDIIRHIYVPCLLFVIRA